MMKAMTDKKNWVEPKIYDKNPNMLVPYYLMHSYLYYKEDNPIISDGEYDSICKRLHSEWDNVEHFHKHLIDKEMLIAGTGYTLEYPNRVIDAAKLLKENNE